MNLFRLFSPHLTKIRAFIYTILIIVTFLGLCYLIFHFFGQMDFFHALLEKAGVSLGGRALSFALCKRLGCSRGLTLAIIFAVSILFTADGRPSLGKMVLPEGSEPSVNQGPGGNDAGPSNAGPSNVAPPYSPWESFPEVPDSLSPLPSDPSVPSLPSIPSLKGSGEREQSVDQPVQPQPQAIDALRANVRKKLGIFLSLGSDRSVQTRIYSKTWEALQGDAASAEQLGAIEEKIFELLQRDDLPTLPSERAKWLLRSYPS